MKRTFIALDILPSAKTKAAYETIRQKLGHEKINWIPDDNLHITINFLGDTREEILPGLLENIRQHN